MQFRIAAASRFKSSELSLNYVNLLDVQCRRWSAAALLAVSAFWLPGSEAAEKSAATHSITPVPAWVTPVEAGSARAEDDAVGGERHLLVDRQYRDDGDTGASHRHYVTEVVGQAGLSDNSKLSITFDPGYQRLELHSATIIRDGLRSDRLERARISVARTEDSSHLDLLHGQVTALVIFSDVRVGDVVEFRYTIIGRNPVFGPRHHSSWRVRWGVPVLRSALRITTPMEQTLSYTSRPEANFREKSTAGLRTLSWQWDNLQPSVAEDNTPDWLVDPDLLSVTAYQNWQEVADWGASLFAEHPAKSEAYRKLKGSLRDVAASEGLQPAIAMAIDHVQKRIRYYGLELGVNSHRPHGPDEVLANGYGDCKDKALLLVELLDELGVKAWPILVSTRIGKGIVDRLPSPGMFNHVVVVVEQGDEQYWVDATDNRQSGLLGSRGQPEYGAGLVLGKAGEALMLRKAPTPTEPTIMRHDSFYLSSMGGPVDYVSSTTYRGQDANWFRRNLDKNGKRRLQKRYLDHYRKVFGDARSLGPLGVVEDKKKNTIVVTKRYRLDEFFTIDKRSQQAEFDVYASVIRAQLDELPRVDKKRKAPIALDGPVRLAHRIQIHPNVASDQRALEETTFGFDGFHYTDSEYVLGDSLVFDSELVISVDQLPLSKVKAYNKFRERVMINAQSGRFYREFDRDAFELGPKTTELLNELGALHE